MITDALLLFEEDMLMPNATETDAANAPLDLQAIGGVGGSGKLVAVGIITKSSTLSTNVCMKVYSDDTNAATLVYTGPVVATADAVKGVVLGAFTLPADIGRYIKAALITVGVGANAGTVSLFITNHPVKSM